MRTHLLRPGLVLAFCSLVSACQTAPQNAAVECGAGGAGVGFLLCKIMGGKDADCLGIGAVVGGIGAAACYDYGSKLDERRQELAGHEDDLDQRIAYVRGLNEDTQRLNTDLRRRVAEATKRTNELVAQKARLTQDQITKARQSQDAGLQVARNQVAEGTQALAAVKAYRAQRKPSSPDLDAEIVKQERLLAEAQRQVEQLAAQRARV